MLLFINTRTKPVMSFLLFQNISCYCLSCKASAKAMILDISKHLMLLFIQYRKVAEHEYFIISKHLMLLFIELMRMKNENPNLFQNISCYCLSLLHDPKYGCVHHFKTSHVIVYLLRCHRSKRQSFISKHLMLLFIK